MKTRFCTALLGLFVICSCSDVKDAADFGFLPSNSPEENSAAFQRCLDGGGKIVVNTPGVYDVCKTLFLDSDTDLEFSGGVILRRAKDDEGISARYVFLNRGAMERAYNDNISIKGLTIECSGIDGGTDVPDIVGLRGHLSFFYARHIRIENFRMHDLLRSYFAIHVCTFEDVSITDVHIEGLKDAVHFGTGRDFLVRDGVFKTFDDPIALNAHDYPGSNPEMGWIENGLIENCYDLEDPEHGTTGFFARVIAGAWKDWEEGMEIQQHGDAVISEGRIYRSNGPVEEKSYISTCRPTHESGTMTYPDGIIWTMSQNKNVDYSCGVRNVLFRNIYLQKKRPIALSLHFDKDKWSRSYYPGAVLPVQSEITFEGLHVEADIPVLLHARTGVDHFTVRDSEIGTSKIVLCDVNTPGMVYDTTRITLENVSCEDVSTVISSENRPYKVEIK